jgi:fructosamine-3-kinase
MDLPDPLHDALETHLDTPIQDVIAVSGGCIANACRLETDAAPLFLKWGDADVARTFPGEAAGLEALAAADSDLHVPAVEAIDVPTQERPGFLLLAWINTGRQGRRFWEDFGRGLAHLHRTTADRYGFDRDNFIGQLPQSNTWRDAWPEFFRRERLEPQVERARENDRWKAAWDAPLKRLDRRLDDLLPADPPASVLHGDLWKGNFMVTAIGKPALIDPATYYGHREADLAMTELFGGFEAAFYDAYREAWPLEPGYDERREVYNLYHLINHLNHFGAGYANSVASTLQTFA